MLTQYSGAIGSSAADRDASSTAAADAECTSTICQHGAPSTGATQSRPDLQPHTASADGIAAPATG